MVTEICKKTSKKGEDLALYQIEKSFFFFFKKFSLHKDLWYNPVLLESKICKVNSAVWKFALKFIYITWKIAVLEWD